LTARRTAQLHASCVAIGGRGVLIRGRPGAGKSDLALRLIDAGARLVADDRVAVARRGDTLVATAPRAIRGLIEARGLGILAVRPAARARLRLIVDLVPAGRVARLPRPATRTILGVRLPRLALAAFEASAAAKVRLAVRAAARDKLAP
jgi:serine kinase of HPr protein (carbohydrate metabolism regulator)